MPTGTIQNPVLAQQLLDAIDEASGLHPGFRPAHAKGLMCSGTFTPSPEAVQLTRAPHASRPSTSVTVRYSDGTGLPNIPDSDPRSGPRGMAIRFHLGEHDHTDIIAHSTNGFPVRTGEEFLEFIRSATAFAAGRPEALGSFLAAHSNAKRFVNTQTDPNKFCERGVLRRHVVQVHQRPGTQPAWPIPHSARSGHRVPLGRAGRLTGPGSSSHAYGAAPSATTRR